MNSSSDSLVKNLSDNDFKSLYKEFSGEFLRISKTYPYEYPYEYMNSFETFSENKPPDIFKFFNSLKDECVN